MINDVIWPICNVPSSILCPPTQMIKIDIPSMRNIRIGIRNDITMPIKSCVLKRSLLAFSNLASSFFSVLNALITGIPVRISLEILFTLSTSFWTLLNLGTAMPISTNRMPNINATARPIIQPIPDPVRTTCMIPAMASIGA